jgi:hypothetical protein
MRKIIILGSFFILFFNTLYAKVEAFVDQSIITKGDDVVFTIKASGKDIVFPQIFEIEGFTITGTSSSQNISIINGNMQKTLSKSYTFTPRANLTIPSFDVEIDGKKEKTKSISVSVKEYVADANSPFLLEANISNKNLYVGQSAVLSIKFKRKYNTKVAKLNFLPPKMDNIWSKPIENTQNKYNEGNYIVQEIKYLVFPQKSGKLQIPSSVVEIATRHINSASDLFDMFATVNLKWKKIFSNNIDLNVSSLPNGIELYGDFDISAKVDKTQTKANQPINLTLNISGNGNIDDIQSFDINIPNATIYKDTPTKKTFLELDTYKGVFIQKFSILGDGNFTIPSLKLSYFDKKTKKVKTKTTQPFNITVKQTKTAQMQQNKIEKLPQQQPVQTHVKSDTHTSYKFHFIEFISGIAIGLILTFLLQIKLPKKEKNPLSIQQKIKKAKNNKQLFDALLPLTNKNDKLDHIIKQLEENIYHNGKNKVNKKEILDTIPAYD